MFVRIDPISGGEVSFSVDRPPGDLRESSVGEQSLALRDLLVPALVDGVEISISPDSGLYARLYGEAIVTASVSVDLPTACPLVMNLRHVARALADDGRLVHYLRKAMLRAWRPGLFATHACMRARGLPAEIARHISRLTLRGNVLRAWLVRDLGGPMNSIDGMSIEVEVESQAGDSAGKRKDR